MKTILVVIFIFFQVYFSKAQVYETKSIIDTAENILKKAVGENVFKYYEYDQKSYYAYRTKSGKVKYYEITKKEMTKGDFINVNVRFVLRHPEFTYDYVNKTTNVQLDSALRLTSSPNIEFIPEFIRKNKPSNWLTDKQIDEILNTLNLKESEFPIVKRLDYNPKTKKYSWSIFNTLVETEYYSDVEFLQMDPVTGEILLRKDEREYVMYD